MLYASTINATWEDVKAVAPPPATEQGPKGPGHKPIRHSTMINKIEEVMRQRGFSTHDWRFILAREGNTDILASCRVATKENSSLAQFAPGLGVTYSNAGRRVLTFYTGLVERETDSPIVYAYTQGGRFTHSFNLDQEIEWAVADWNEHIESCQPIKKLISREFTVDEVDLIMQWVIRKRIAASSRVRNMDRMLFGLKKINGMSLFRAFAQSVNKQIAPYDQLHNSHQFCVTIRAVAAGVLKQKREKSKK